METIPANRQQRRAEERNQQKHAVARIAALRKRDADKKAYLHKKDREMTPDEIELPQSEEEKAAGKTPVKLTSAGAELMQIAELFAFPDATFELDDKKAVRVGLRSPKEGETAEEATAARAQEWLIFCSLAPLRSIRIALAQMLVAYINATRAKPDEQQAQPQRPAASLYVPPNPKAELALMKQLNGKTNH